MSSQDRWGHVFALASKIKRCGEDTDDGCGCKQPTKIKKEGLIDKENIFYIDPCFLVLEYALI